MAQQVGKALRQAKDDRWRTEATAALHPRLSRTAALRGCRGLGHRDSALVGGRCSGAGQAGEPHEHERRHPAIRGRLRGRQALPPRPDPSAAPRERAQAHRPSDGSQRPRRGPVEGAPGTSARQPMDRGGEGDLPGALSVQSQKVQQDRAVVAVQVRGRLCQVLLHLEEGSQVQGEIQGEAAHGGGASAGAAGSRQAPPP
mmetsp:Transcript_21954/g.57319  ORF Transcript_21954/g.57319 Transcript_21954/m.57319 type:complete len:200 (-) Transcript_21954:1333-1932(-)